jgi:hypothetical protein
MIAAGERVIELDQKKDISVKINVLESLFKDR